MKTRGTGISRCIEHWMTLIGYHIGESMLHSRRHYVRFIDLDDEFNHGPVSNTRQLTCPPVPLSIAANCTETRN